MNVDAEKAYSKTKQCQHSMERAAEAIRRLWYDLGKDGADVEAARAEMIGVIDFLEWGAQQK